MTEENFLTKKFGDAYTKWCKETPVIFPKFSNWRKPDMPFSFRTVLKREYQGLLGVGTAFFVTEFITDVFVEGEPVKYWLQEDIAWPITYAFILVFCLSVRHLKKHTDILKVEGR